MKFVAGVFIAAANANTLNPGKRQPKTEISHAKMTLTDQ